MSAPLNGRDLQTKFIKLMNNLNNAIGDTPIK